MALLERACRRRRRDAKDGIVTVDDLNLCVKELPAACNIPSI